MFLYFHYCILLFANFVAVVIRLLTDIALFFNCIMHLNVGPLEKQRQLKSQPSLKIFNDNNNNNTVCRLNIYIYIYIYIYIFIYLFIYSFIFIFIFMFIYTPLCLYTRNVTSHIAIFVESCCKEIETTRNNNNKFVNLPQLMTIIKISHLTNFSSSSRQSNSLYCGHRNKAC